MRSRPDYEAGVGYLAVLLVLAALTIVGLSLAVVTQTELLSGSQERIMERTFYAAESGLQLSVAKALSEGDYGPTEHERTPSSLEETRTADVRERVETSPFICLVEVPCDLCSINQGRSYTRRNHALGVNAARVGLAGGGEEVTLGRKSLSTMIDVEPHQGAIDCVANVPEAMHGYRFEAY